MWNRRGFLETVSGASLLAGLPLALQESIALADTGAITPIRPKALRPGASVALVAPASPASDSENLKIAEEVVRSLGLVPKAMKNAARATMYLAGTDQERAADVNAAFADPSVDAVWCLRGGYGSPRILPYLDYALIRKNPKPFIGYSDITAPLNAIHKMTGLVTFHGPNGADNQTEFTLAEFKRVLFQNRPAGSIAAPPPPPAPREAFVDKENRLRRIAPGKARGPLVGGNISVFSTLVGTPFEPDLKGRILFLEEVGEEPYRIDRWLTHFLLTGRLKNLAGIVLGKFHDCGPRELHASFNGTWTWQEVCADRLGGLGIPVLAGLRFGHVPDKATLPLGVQAELDVDAGTLTLLEPAVS
jgi:muramoyltetrapeptide carboxypeptidase